MYPMTPLTLAEARALTAAAEAKAAEIGILIATSIVDPAGHLIAFARLDGTQLASTALSQNKAYTAIAWQRPSQEMFFVSQPGQTGYALQAVDSRFVFAGGGMPLSAGGVIVGGVGISGGTAEQDQECAEAAVAAFIR
jgi:uncharacterized protein GlcG (DUF336 family)